MRQKEEAMRRNNEQLGKEQAGMGLGVGDYNLDGHLDVFKTNFADDTNVLYENDGKANFEDKTISSKLGEQSRYISWGTAIADLDNDGWPDIFFVSGNVYPEVEKQLPNYPDKCPRTVYRNLGNGTFERLREEAGPGIAAKHSSRGCAFGDFDNDGDIDAIVWNMNEPPSLLRNDLKNGNHWLKLKLIGTRSNRTALGARVTVTAGGRRQVQEVLSQSSFYSQNDLRLHFGLGQNAVMTKVEVAWPSGQKDVFQNLPADMIYTMVEGGTISQKTPFSK